MRVALSPSTRHGYNTWRIADGIMKIDRIYTRGGDHGQTSLGDGTRVAKHALRVRAMGDVDEANAAIGVAIAGTPGAEWAVLLLRVQNDLFDLGADLCVPQPAGAEQRPRLRLAGGQVRALEAEIDRINATLGPLTSFVLPGGLPAAAQLHLARSIVRRAERDVAELAASEPLNPELLKYLNRLSDLLFVLARQANDGGAADVLWQPGLNR
jgi:cob(I)alamin adenosyltransferase